MSHSKRRRYEALQKKVFAALSISPVIAFFVTFVSDCQTNFNK